MCIIGISGVTVLIFDFFPKGKKCGAPVIELMRVQASLRPGKLSAVELM